MTMNKKTIKSTVSVILLIYILYYSIGWWFIFTKDKPHYIQYIGGIIVLGGVIRIFLYLKQNSK